MKKLSVGVIGLGSMGSNHVRALQKNRNIKRIVILDNDVSRTKPFANDQEFTIAKNLDDFIFHVDAAIIATNTLSHFQIASSLIESKTPVLIEKPVTDKINEAKKLKEMADKNKTAVCVGHIERFNPTIGELKNLLQEYTPLSVTMQRLSYNISRATDVNVMLDLMLHDIDAAYYLFNKEIKFHYSYSMNSQTHVDDYCTALFTSDSIPITITASKISQTRKREIQITCKEGFINADLDRRSIHISKNPSSEYYASKLNFGYKQSAITEQIWVPQEEPLLIEHNNFLSYIFGEENKSVKLDDAIRVLELIKSIEKYES